MFTGIIEALGTIVQIKPASQGESLVIRAYDLDFNETKIGDSIATNGVCLTVTDFNRENKTFTADVSHETYNLTNLKDLKIGDEVQLERALQLNGRINGHLVSGHVDGIGTVKNIIPGKMGTDYILEFSEDLAPFIAQKGSITVNGISLTVNDVTSSNELRLTIIPHTQKVTGIGKWSIGTKVNLEVDVIARYLARLMNFAVVSNNPITPNNNAEKSNFGVTSESLRNAGFI